jgi:hypothetical protein
VDRFPGFLGFSVVFGVLMVFVGHWALGIGRWASGFRPLTFVSQVEITFLAFLTFPRFFSNLFIHIAKVGGLEAGGERDIWLLASVAVSSHYRFTFSRLVWWEAVHESVPGVVPEVVHFSLGSKGVGGTLLGTKGR